MAHLTGHTTTTLIKLESGANKNPTVKTLQQLAYALEVSLDQLMEEYKNTVNIDVSLGGVYIKVLVFSHA